MRAMILAAGFGERLRPYTLQRPKPLFPICNQPLLDILLQHLADAGFHDIVVNAHHLAGQIKNHLDKRATALPRVHLQVEEAILGTGGGIRQARPFFGADPVLVWNGDIYATIDPARVLAEHCRSGAAATLVLHDFPRFNKVAVAADGRILGFGDDLRGPALPCRTLAFTGIQVLDPAILHHVPSDAFASIIDCHRAVIREGGRVQALVVQGHCWSDIGTPGDYLALHQRLLEDPGARLSAVTPGRAPFCIAATARVPESVRLSGWAAVGADAVIGEGAHLSRVVVGDGARVPDGALLADTIVF